MKPGERIQILRILSGLSQEDLGTAVGRPRNTFSRWEHGHSERLSADVTEKIAKCLKVNPSYLSFGTPLLTSGVWTCPISILSQHRPHTFTRLFRQLLEENKITNCLSADFGEGYCALLFGRASGCSTSYIFSLVCPYKLSVPLLADWPHFYQPDIGVDVSGYTPEQFQSEIVDGQPLNEALNAQGLAVRIPARGSCKRARACPDREAELEKALSALVDECLDSSGAVLRPRLKTIRSAIKVLSR